MNTIYKGKTITSILTIIPETESYFEDEVDNYSFPAKQTLRLKRVMGYEKHRLSKVTSTVSDFSLYGMNYMMSNNWLKREDIGAIVVVTLSPDYFVPHVSNIIHGALKLSNDILCMDISQGCCGFLIGLSQACMLLEHMKGKKIVLINADTLSHKVSKYDRNDFPLMGDGAAITVIENDANASDIYYEMHMDGSRGDALKIPAGAFRMPSTSETAVLEDAGDGNLRSLDHMHMDGGAVFNFVQSEVPPMLERVFNEKNLSVGSIDYFLFHQPNKFMLQKLAEKAGIPKDKLPMNLVENYGNTSGASIPMTAVHNLKEELTNKKYKCCLSAFGSGLAWGVMLMELGGLQHCEMLKSNL